VLETYIDPDFPQSVFDRRLAGHLFISGWCMLEGMRVSRTICGELLYYASGEPYLGEDVPQPRRKLSFVIQNEYQALERLFGFPDCPSFFLSTHRV